MYDMPEERRKPVKNIHSYRPILPMTLEPKPFRESRKVRIMNFLKRVTKKVDKSGGK